MTNCKLPFINHKIEVLSSEFKHQGFNEIRLTKNKIYYDIDSEEVSEEFELDLFFKKYPDAVIIVPYILEPEPYIFLTSCLRPSQATANYPAFQEEVNVGNTWELPAGCVDPEEYDQSLHGYKVAAARELKEETGLIVEPNELSFLGKRSFTGSGSERLFFLDVEIKNQNKIDILGDGHPLEKHTRTCKISLHDALSYIDAGYLTDAKTEIGLRRLFNKLERKKHAQKEKRTI